MMELFTLGADRGAYTERDVREQARSLTGWTSRWSRRTGQYDFHFDASRHDPGMKTVFRKPGDYDWRDACRLCLQNPKHPSFFIAEAVELLHPASRPTRRRSARSKLRIAAAARSSRCSTSILRHPALLHGPAHDEAAGRPHRGPAAEHPAGVIDTTPGPGSAACRPAALLPAERRGLGRHALARHRDVPRPLDRRRRDRGRPAPRSRAKAEGGARRRRRLLKRALAFWNNPTLTPATHAPVAPLRPARAHDARSDEVEAGAVPGARRRTPCGSSSRVTRPSDRMSDGSSATSCTRADCPARGCGPRPARDRARACPTPAGTGLSRRGFFARSRRARAHGLRRAAALDIFDEGIARGRGDAAEPDPRHRVPAGRRRRAVAALTARRPALPQAAPEPRNLRRAPRSPRTTASSGTRRSLRSRSFTARARSPCFLRSGTTIPTSRTSRRATSGRSARRTRGCSPAGWAATSTRSARPTTRCRGCR